MMAATTFFALILSTNFFFRHVMIIYSTDRADEHFLKSIRIMMLLMTPTIIHLPYVIINPCYVDELFHYSYHAISAKAVGALRSANTPACVVGFASYLSTF